MTLEKAKEEQNKTLRLIPMGLWRRFKGKCGTEGISLTQGFIEAANLWLEKD